MNRIPVRFVCEILNSAVAEAAMRVNTVIQ